ncbi:hypothetical protein WME89_29965 [Sorangium sp. So ce321]|uniref:hypothetical protein n=1 Tax=Sorangium sp. So ce321 TaxID=3133300 RepID=UPI003F5DAF58
MRHGDTGVWYGFRGAVLLATTLAVGCTIGGGGQGGAGGEPATGGGGQGGAGGEPRPAAAARGAPGESRRPAAAVAAQRAACRDRRWAAILGSRGRKG